MRPLNRVLAFFLGLGLAAFGVIVVVETTLLLAGRSAWIIPRERWDRNLAEQDWDHPTLVLVLALVLAAGVVLLLAQLVPRRPRRLPVRTEHDDRQLSVSRRGLEGQLTRVTRRDQDIIDARVRINRRRARLKAVFADASNESEVGVRIGERARDQLQRLDLVRPLHVKVRLRPGAKRVR